MSEKVTIFHAKKTTNKTPMSPYDDNTFIFETYETQSNYDIYSIMVSHFILNIPLEKLPRASRLFRRKVDLEKYYTETIKYFILDIDGVKSEFDKQKILEYFKDYRVILGESRSYNGIDNFNMKGVLFTEEIDFRDAKLALSVLNHDLKDLCIVDESVTRKASLNAPMLKNKVFLNNEDGILFKYVRKEMQEHINDIKKEYIGEAKTTLNIDELTDIEADTMEKLCLKVFQAMGFTAIKNNPNGSITFKHPSENKTPGGYFWFTTAPYTMHHANSTKTINIFDDVRRLPAAKELMKKEINYDDEFLNFNTDANVLQINEKFLKVTPEMNSLIESYLNGKNGLLSIRSAMGTGKSTIIKHIVDECHELDMKVLIVTNRISVANDFGKKYNMKVYNQDKYEHGDSLVCQYDSLWKYNIKFFDIVIMDEFISLMIHSRSNLNVNSINIAKFFGCFNKKLVIADAFLTGYENFLLSNKKTNVHIIDNLYRDNTVLYDYTDMNYFVQSIIVHAEKSKITISSTSLSFIHSIQLLLENKGLRVLTLTAETPESTKKLVYELFEEDDHDKWDVLVYSPTLTVGVSNLNNVRYHFHYDSSISADVISSIQMIKRTRKTKEIHMCIKEKVNYLKTSYNDIRDEYIGNIGRNINHNYLFDIDDYGEAKLSEIGKKAVKIDTFKNILEFNHKSAIMWMLKWHFMHEPRIVNQKFSGNVLFKYQKKIKSDRKALLKSNIGQYLRLNDIERETLMFDPDTDRIICVIAEIDENIIKCSAEVKIEIIHNAINDNQFIEKCKMYSLVKKYMDKILDDTDIRYRVSQSVIRGDGEDLHFFNTLLEVGQQNLKDVYIPKEINKSTDLKYILDRCGYSMEKLFSEESSNVLGQRVYKINDNVKKYHEYIIS